MIQLDLQKQYNLLNKSIFNNTLPSSIPVKWNHSRTSMGKTRIKGNLDGSPEISITISRFFLCTQNEYIEPLIHEMIHVYMAVHGEFKKDGRVHGPLFRSHMNRINREFPQYRISIKENGPLKIDRSRIKTQNGFLLCMDKNIHFNLFCREIDNTLQNHIIKHIPGLHKIRSGDIIFFTGQYEEFATAPIRQNKKTLTHKLQYFKDKKRMRNIKKIILENEHIHYPIKRNIFFRRA